MQEGEDEDALMRRVDTALYQARDEGRNRVVTCDMPLACNTEIAKTSEWIADWSGSYCKLLLA
jgi:2-phospho-L-lactate guanylyltransferase (CobY/MobA/RfbA family)